MSHARDCDLLTISRVQKIWEKKLYCSRLVFIFRDPPPQDYARVTQSPLRAKLYGDAARWEKTNRDALRRQKNGRYASRCEIVRASANEKLIPRSIRTKPKGLTRVFFSVSSRWSDMQFFTEFRVERFLRIRGRVFNFQCWFCNWICSFSENQIELYSLIVDTHPPRL